MLEIFSLDWNQVVVDLIRVGISFLLALPIGWERARGKHSLGFRTFPMVAIASCGYMLIVQPAVGLAGDIEGRVLQGLMTGIGFIGGGAILKQNASVYGLATAASIWNTGAIGAAVALQREEIAILLSLINFLMLYFLTPIAYRYRQNGEDQIAEVE